MFALVLYIRCCSKGRSRVICLRFAFGISWVFIRCRTGEGLWVTAWNYQQSIHLASANVANKECRRVTYQIKAEYINILILTMDHMRMCNVNSWWDSWWWTSRELSPDSSSPQFSSDLASSGSQFSIYSPKLYCFLSQTLDFKCKFVFYAVTALCLWAG